MSSVHVTCCGVVVVLMQVDALAIDDSIATPLGQLRDIVHFLRHQAWVLHVVDR